MDMYYEVLGLKPGAAQAEIKRAYFSMVRQHSPEKDPERFREIREAYEHLKSMDENQEPVFAPPKEPWAKRFLNQIQIYQKRGDDVLVRDACEEAWRAFPDEIQFLYLLAKAQRRAGNTGKAVKSNEELVKKDPKNKWFWRELAFSYQERGYTRKAFGAFDRAYDLGCRDNDFVLGFSLSCNEYGQYDKGIQILTELVRREKRWQKEDIPQILEAYTGLITMNGRHMDDPEGLTKLAESFKCFFKQYTIYLEENKDVLAELIGVFSLFHQFAGPKYHKEILEILEIFEGACRSDEGKELTATLKEAVQGGWAHEDPRLNETMQGGIETYFMMDGMDSELRTFAVLDMKLCMIKEREEILPQLDIIEEEYPIYFEKIKDFAGQLRDGRNLEHLKSSMLRQYSRMAQYVGGGEYFEKYPQEKEKQMGKVIYQSEDFTPYVRSGKKIGRNDPCPCGSGKKYKHCCMRKNAG